MNLQLNDQREPTYQEVIIKFEEGISQDEIHNFFDRHQSMLQEFSADVAPSFDGDDGDQQILDELQEKARQNSNRDIPSLKLFWRVRLTELIADDDELDNLVEQLADNEEVEYAARAARPAPPPAANYENNQGYLDPPAGAPPQGGVDAKHAWVSGFKGANVRVCDCEYGFNHNHNDLPNVTVISNRDWQLTTNQEHGTSVLGVLAGQANGQGVTGICHEATILFASESGGHRTDCLNDLIIAVHNGSLDPGDIVLLEMQSGEPAPGLPAEYDGDVHTAVSTLVGLHIVVVAAAGNNDVNLDNQTAPRGPRRTLKYIWRKEHSNYDDSGAIIVGAGHAPTNWPHKPHAKIPTSAYGSRVNCQGWGNKVVTAGTGDLYNTEGPNHYYTDSFDNTSSAAAMVAGVVACLQDYAKSSLGRPLEPLEIRDLLSQDALGTPQQDELPKYPKATHHIGPLPNLLLLIQQLQPIRNVPLTPDV